MNTQNNPPPFCISCKNFLPADPAKPTELMGAHRCGAIPMLDLVTGQRYQLACEMARTPDAPCGTQAKMFTPKDEPLASN